MDFVMVVNELFSPCELESVLLEGGGGAKILYLTGASTPCIFEGSWYHPYMSISYFISQASPTLFKKSCWIY